jgi:hypothetical protein
MVRESLKHNTLIERSDGGRGRRGSQHLYSLNIKEKKKTYSWLKRESSAMFVYLRSSLSHWWLGRGGSMAEERWACPGAQFEWRQAHPPDAGWSRATWALATWGEEDPPICVFLSVTWHTHTYTHTLLTCHIAQVATIALIGSDYPLELQALCYRVLTRPCT